MPVSATKKKAVDLVADRSANVAASQWFAQDSPLEERGFEPLVPPQHNRGTGPMSPTASIPS
jgi:hypothetical protein